MTSELSGGILGAMEDTANTIVLACWGSFIVYWMISALRTKKIVERQSLGSKLAQRIPVAIGFWLIFDFRLPHPMNLHVLPRTDLTMALGAAVCIAGLMITIWARRTLAGNWSSDVTFKEGHELVRQGPYRFVRHPIYTGLLVMSLGAAIEATQLHCWIGMTVAGIGFWIKLSQEEQLLARHFPDQYPVYRKEVKALVPWIL
jgi:protein-S-isoprenylcysteine O-methyltransferase Ste14